MPHSDHFPEIVPVDQVSVLVHGLRLEHERARLHEALLVHRAHLIDHAALIVPDHQLDPGLDDIERSRGEIVPHLVRGDDALEADLLSGLHLRGSL